MNIKNNVSEIIGNTPLLKLNGIMKLLNLNANIYAKVEALNPAGSIKDRAALYIIKEAEKSGRLLPGGTIIEPTSGNTGIGLASLATLKGYKCIIVMPDSMSEERKKIIRAYGAQLILTPGIEGMAGAIKKAQEINKKISNSIIAGQFENKANPLAHEMTTGPEIYDALDGNIDAFVAAAGSGGTVSGVGKYLKGICENIKVFCVEPLESNIINGGKANSHGIQGIGANIIPQNLDLSVVDETIDISTEESKKIARLVAKTEGLLIGISGGCNLAATIKVARLEEMRSKNIVTIFPDSGERYLSTDLFD